MTALLIVLWAFWGVYVLIMGLYRAHLQKRLSWTAYALGAPFLLIGLALDFAVNMTLATVIFLDIPREALVTTRLIRYVASGSGWRFNVANWVCNKLLDVFDPSGEHC